MQAGLCILDDVLEADRLKVPDRSKFAFCVGIASCLITMPARSCANVEPMDVGEWFKLTQWGRMRPWSARIW